MTSSAPDGKIKPIERAAVHRIASGQVVLDLATAVKELVENSLDAGATSIDIRLKDHGAEVIEVADNGTGVSPENFQGLTLKYHTSKISKFGDLQALSSFGFRGEALSSLCALAKVTIVTRTKGEAVAVRLEYDHSGVLVSKENVARAVGTTVTVVKLFSPLPVRFKEFRRENNVRREYGRLLSILQAYALIAKGVRLICSNQTGRAARHVVVQTQGNTLMRDNVVTVFGTKTAASMEFLNLTLSHSCTVEGLVSKPGSGCGRPTGDRQFFYVNGRPVDMPKVAKLLNEMYRSFNSLQYPMLILNFILPTTAYDVNVTPDKRKLFLHSENELLAALKESLEKVYAPTKYSYALNSLESGSLSVDVTPSANKLGKSLQEVNVPLQTPLQAGASNDEEGEMSENETDTRLERNVEIKTNISGKIPLDLLAFQSKSVKASTERSFDGTKEIRRGPAASSSTTMPNVDPGRKIQATLTACVSRKKRPMEGSDGALFSEEPLLKQWKRSISKDESSDEDKGEDCHAVHDIGFGESCASGEHVGDLSEAMNNSERVEHQPPRVGEDNADLRPNATILKAGMIPCSNSGLGKNVHLTSSTQLAAEGRREKEVAREVPASRHQLESFHRPRRESDLCPEAFEENSLANRTGNEEQTADKLLTSGDSSTIVDCQKKVDGLAKTSGGKPKIQFDMDKLRRLFDLGLLRDQMTTSKTLKRNPKRSCFAAATLNAVGEEGVEKEAVLAAATKELERSFNKADFKKMKVLGQFNLGFILAKIDQDIFIIDQHASDEKHNFERLTKTTTLNRQPLLRPLQLELSAAEEMTVISHIEAFRKNGFDFIENEIAPSGQRLQLSSVPFSQNVIFDVGDVQELISLLADEPVMSLECATGRHDASPAHDHHHKGSQATSSWLPRPTRVRAMLASRACRSSVMIGDPLSKKQMERILYHLAELDSPWNCPHGRPTMRHLVDLSTISS